jgi:hypothetical protein
MMRDWADKSWLRTHRDDWTVLAWCAVYVLVIAAIDWLTQ